MADELKGFDRLGNKISFPDSMAADVVGMGGRLATKEELAEHDLQQQYENQSLPQKALGYAKFAGPAGSLANLALGGGNAAPMLEAYREGTGDLGGAAASKAVTELVQGKPAAQAYAEHRAQLKEAYPTTSAAGNLANMAGSAIAGPAAGIGGATSALGGAVEGGVARGLSGLAARGALGRAATTAAGMAARGAVEGGIISGTEQATDNFVNDKSLGEKLYATMGHGALMGGALGAAAGFGGSLIATGARNVFSKAESAIPSLDEGGGAIAKAGAQAEGKLRDATAAAKGELEGVADQAIAKGGKGIRSAFSDALSDPNATATKMANDQAWRAVGSGFGLQSTRYAKEAAKYFANGTTDLGAIARKYDLIDMGDAGASPAAAAFQAAKSGTPAEILPRAEAALDLVGKKIGTITDASGATIHSSEIADLIDETALKYETTAAMRPAGKSIRAFGDQLLDSLGMLAKDAEGRTVVNPNASASIQDVLDERKAIDRLVFQDSSTLDPKVALEAKRALRSRLEGSITDALDAASGKVPGEERAAYESLKKDYHGLRILTEATEDSAARSSKASMFGFKETMGAVGAAASGHILAAPVLALGGKVLKDRGNAAAAAFLSRAVDTGAITRLVQKFDSKIASSAANVMREGAAAQAPIRSAGKVSAAADVASKAEARTAILATQTRAQNIVQWIGKFNANPGHISDQMEEAAAIVGRAGGPQAAEQYTASTMRAIRFIAAHIPVKERTDPLNPNSTPPLTYDEAATVNQATRYALHPETIFDDFGKGIVTPVGLRAANTLAPDTMATFQDYLRDHVTDHLLRNGRLTWSKRLQLDKLGIESIRPDSVASIQANLLPAPPEPPPANQGPPPPRPLNMQVQQTGFDAVEARVSS